ncbi:hypothetical protein [Pseudonocardia lacus]|uniref:hypothetical protein n=1 Tax=Pseudonocardia lacus TaxID=2835865 RepID=UPI001BDD67B6|nr:hypothetical protein [Pseudonocardia lacus]
MSMQTIGDDLVPPSWRPGAVAALVAELRARLRSVRWQLMDAVGTDVEKTMLRFELDQLEHALGSDSPAAGTAFGWRRVRELVRDRVPAAAPITGLVHELFG